MDARTAWEFDVSRCDVCASMHETRGGMFLAEERNVQGRSRITGDSGRVIVNDCVVAGALERMQDASASAAEEKSN